VGFLDTAEIFGFYENWGISWPVERLSLSQEKLCSMELKYVYKNKLTPDAEKHWN
jgi:hypothetical protein